MAPEGSGKPREAQGTGLRSLRQEKGSRTGFVRRQWASQRLPDEQRYIIGQYNIVNYVKKVTRIWLKY
jgi:hypothetical protein